MGYENTNQRLKDLQERNNGLSLEVARMKSMFGGMGASVQSTGENVGLGLSVGAPGNYKGYKLRAEIDNLIRKRPSLTPERAERICKGFIDWTSRAMEGAVRKAGMNEGTTTAGGFLTPQELDSEWSSYIREESIAMSYGRIIPMNSDVKLVNREDATVMSLSGVKLNTEATAAAEIDPTVAQTTLTAKRMDGYVRVTNEDLEDATVAGGFVNQLMDQFAEAVGQTIDSCVFLGPGDPVSGIFKSAGLSATFGTGSSNFSELLESDLREIVGKVRKARSPQWYMHRTALWSYVYNLKDTTGRPLFLVNGNSIFGYNVQEVYMAPDTSAAATGFIVYGDLKGFLIGERMRATSLFVDPYTLGLSHQTIFAIFSRYAFAQHLPNMYGRIVTAA